MARTFSFAAVSLAATTFIGFSAAAQKEIKFEVLSIKPLSGMPSSMNSWPTSNGFTSTLSLWQVIMIAWGPGGDAWSWATVQILNAPKWIGDFYEINGRVSQADLREWQNQSNEHELLRSALRTALNERCNLVLHEQPAQRRMFGLAVGKHGAQLKPADPNFTLPVGVKLINGGVMVGQGINGRDGWKWYGATMQDLARYLSQVSGPIPVRDRTGLTGRYDFPLQHVELSPDDERVLSYPVDHLGLVLKSGMENRPELVIDHIDKPTPN